MIRLRRFALLLPFAALAAGCARPSAGVPFARAVAYPAFAPGDTTRSAEWRASERRAADVVAPFAARVRALPGRWRLLAVAERSCGDAIHSIPFLAALDSAAPNLELRLLRAEVAGDLLAAHPYEARQATPVVVVLDEAFAERGAWIERPASARDHLRRRGSTDEATALRAWRRQDGGRSVLEEVTRLLERAAAGGDPR